MTDKYYTPTIDEFRVGFEYEAQDLCLSLSGTCWVKEKYQGEELRTYLTDELERKEIRVKQLDREDIESLGLIYISKNEYRTVFWIPNTEFELDFYKDRTIYIGNTETYECHKCLFDGKIKNKSELQVLLKQLTIL